MMSSFLLLAASCRKADYHSTNLTEAVDKTKVNTIFASLRSKPEVLYVTAGVYTEVRASKGTRFRFYPNSFKDKNGRTISSGTVQLSVIEMYGAGASIANRSVSLSGNQLLHNTGQVYITASVNGEEIGVNKYGIDFLTSTRRTSPMSLYYGVDDYDDSLVRWMRVGTATGTIVNGTIIDTMSVIVVDTVTSVDTAQIYRNYNQFDSCGALHWVSSQYPAWTTTSLTNISVIPTDTSFNAFNTAVFVVFTDFNAAVPLGDYNSQTHAFSLTPGYSIPMETRIDIVTIGYKGGLLYYAVQRDITLIEGVVFAPAMVPHTVNEVLNLLALL
jgi:hypothetical protein